MKLIKKVYYKGVHRYSFRRGKIAEIVGVEEVLQDNNIANICFKVLYSDGVYDWCPIDDKGAYELFSIVDHQYMELTI
jgi:hypothetical protein